MFSSISMAQTFSAAFFAAADGMTLKCAESCMAVANKQWVLPVQNNELPPIKP